MEPLTFQSSLLIVSGVSSALFFVLRNTRGQFPVSWLIKFLGVFCLSVYVVMVEKTPIERVLAAGLFLHSIGDLGLELSKDDTSETGAAVPVAVTSFFAGHIIYGYVFWSTTQKLELTVLELSSLAFIISLVGYTAYVWVRYMRSPRYILKAFACIYLIALSMMGVMAVLSRGPESFGGMLYILSDCIIFCEATGIGFPVLKGPAVWPLYYTAQTLITYGVLHFKKHV